MMRSALQMRRGMLVMLMLGTSLAGGARADPSAANTNAPLSLVPPMGFNNWARFQCLPQSSLDGRARAGYGFQDFMLDQGRSLVSSGLAHAGYRSVVVDDCWMERGQDGELHGISHWGSFRHPSSQPGFDNDLTAYMTALHKMGLEGGVYNTSGKSTCQRVAAGAQGHQSQDAAKFASWGVDFLKLDNCGADDAELPELFRQMGAALGQATAQGRRKILFDESAPAQYGPADPMKYRSMEWVRPLGQMWRVAPDIRVTHIGPDGDSLYDPWSFNDVAQGYEEGVYQAYTDTVALSRYVAPGNWNDADQLLIGDDGLTPAEERSQMGLWSIMGAPLIISADLRTLERHRADPRAAASLSILGNRRAIAVDQDPLGAGGYRVLRDRSADDTGVDISLKRLADGGIAFLILNKNPIAIDYTLKLSRLGMAERQCALTLTNIWDGRTQIVDQRSAVSGHIGSHDNMMLRVAPAACMGLVPTGQITVAQAEFATPPLCLQAGQNGEVTTESCSADAAQQWRVEADGHLRTGSAPSCLAVDQAGGKAHVMACANTPAQRFDYHRSGMFTSSGGMCLGVETAKVGHGGLIGQQGAAIRAESCKPFAPDQVFSAPYATPPPA